MCISMRPMRTTVELTDDQRAELLRLAARKGIKGFSQIVQEAVDQYLRREVGKEEAIGAALSLEGCLVGEEAAKFEERIHSIRELWRCS
jgi:metal-responsive CopG/Arc/MetJ family transcriptional regulator